MVWLLICKLESYHFFRATVKSSAVQSTFDIYFPLVQCPQSRDLQQQQQICPLYARNVNKRPRYVRKNVYQYRVITLPTYLFMLPPAA